MDEKTAREDGEERLFAKVPRCCITHFAQEVDANHFGMWMWRHDRVHPIFIRFVTGYQVSLIERKRGK